MKYAGVKGYNRWLTLKGFRKNTHKERHRDRMGAKDRVGMRRGRQDEGSKWDRTLSTSESGCRIHRCSLYYLSFTHLKLSPFKKLVFPFKQLVKKLTGCEVKSWL